MTHRRKEHGPATMAAARHRQKLPIRWALYEEPGITGRLLIEGGNPVADIAAELFRCEHDRMYSPIIGTLLPKS